MSKTEAKKDKHQTMKALLGMKDLEDVFKQWLPLLAAKAVDMNLAYECAQKLLDWHNNLPTSEEERAGDKDTGARAARSRAGLFLCVCVWVGVCLCVNVSVSLCVCVYLWLGVSSAL